MRKHMLVMPLAAFGFVLGTSLSASAASVTFDFNSLASGAAVSGGVTGAGATSIQNYMNYQLGLQTPGVTVGAPTGAITDKGYNGDGHVTGTTTRSNTLGTMEGSTPNAGTITCTGTGCTGATLDTFVKNNSPATSWTFAFIGGMVIDSVKFDYEIFPDASGTTPDMTFSTNLGEVFHYYGVTPLSTGNDSPVSTTETTKQLIGNTGILTSANVIGANSLTFTDWPVTIGIDNLTIEYHTNAAVPEPGSMLLLGTGLAGLYARRKKRQAA